MRFPLLYGDVPRHRAAHSTPTYTSPLQPLRPLQPLQPLQPMQANLLYPTIKVSYQQVTSTTQHILFAVFVCLQRVHAVYSTLCLVLFFAKFKNAKKWIAFSDKTATLGTSW